jgi:hypothetical protein
MWRNYAAEYTGYCMQFATACVEDPDAFDERERRRLDWNAQGGQTGPGYHWYAPQQLTAVVVGGEMPEHLRTQLIERVATRGRAIKILEALQPQVGEVPELREVCAVGVA